MAEKVTQEIEQYKNMDVNDSLRRQAERVGAREAPRDPRRPLHVPQERAADAAVVQRVHLWPLTSVRGELPLKG